MTSRPTALEALLYDRRAHIAGGIVGAVVLAVSLGFFAAAHSPHHFKPLAAHLPEQPLNIPIMRSLPEPIELKGERAARPNVVAPGRYVKPAPAPVGTRVAHR